MQDVRIVEVLKQFLVHYRTANWGDFKYLANVLRVDVLMHEADPDSPEVAVWLLVDNKTSENEVPTAKLDGPRSARFVVKKERVQNYPSLQGDDKYIYFVAK